MHALKDQKYTFLQPVIKGLSVYLFGKYKSQHILRALENPNMLRVVVFKTTTPSMYWKVMLGGVIYPSVGKLRAKDLLYRTCWEFCKLQLPACTESVLLSGYAKSCSWKLIGALHWGLVKMVGVLGLSLRDTLLIYLRSSCHLLKGLLSGHIINYYGHISDWDCKQCRQFIDLCSAPFGACGSGEFTRGITGFPQWVGRCLNRLYIQHWQHEGFIQITRLYAQEVETCDLHRAGSIHLIQITRLHIQGRWTSDIYAEGSAAEREY